MERLCEANRVCGYRFQLRECDTSRHATVINTLLFSTPARHAQSDPVNSQLLLWNNKTKRTR